MAKTENLNVKNEYLNQLIKEQQSLDQQYTNAYKLLQQEIERIRNLDSDDNQRKDNHLVVHTGKQFCLKVKVHIPIDEHPNFNFVGKLLGPKGSSLQQLQEATQTRMAILGRGSMRDKRKEEELRSQGDPKYSHLNEDLHVEISAYAPPNEAYRRMASAIGEIQRFLIPENMPPYRPDQDYYEDMRQYPFREMGPMPDGKPKIPYAKDGPPLPPRGGPPAPARPLPPPMAPPMREPPARRPPPLAQSTYATPESDEWAPAAPRRSYSAAPPRATARGYDDGTDDYNSYADTYADYNSGNSTSYYDYTPEADGAYAANDYADDRGPVRNAGAPRGRSSARLQSHPYAGATRRGY